jgi:hypothetical protein
MNFLLRVFRWLGARLLTVLIVVGVAALAWLFLLTSLSQ